LDKGSLFRNLGEFMLDIFQDFHRVVFSVEDFGHYFHVALRNAFLIPKFLQIGESLVNGLLLPFLVFSQIWLITDFIFIV